MLNKNIFSLIVAKVLIVSLFTFGNVVRGQEIIGNPKPLDMGGDIASKLVEGVDRFLLKEIDRVDSSRVARWKREFDLAKDDETFFDLKRNELKRILGIRDQRVSFDSPELVASVGRASLILKTTTFEVHSIRFPVLDGVHLEGLLLRPSGEAIKGNMIVVPDADQTPEALAGLSDDLKPAEQIGLQLVRRGHQVVIPTIISREMKRRNGRANLTNREYLYRSAFELGRHLIGYEIQKILAVVDWYKKTSGTKQVGVWGIGEGGMLATYAAAIDKRIDKVAVDDFIGGRERNWNYPISRNVFGLLNDFGDAEVLALIAPRPILQLHNRNGVSVKLPSEGGAPAELNPASDKDLARVAKDFSRHVKNLKVVPSILPVQDRSSQLNKSISWFASDLKPGSVSRDALDSASSEMPKRGDLLLISESVDASKRMDRQIREIDRFNQRILAHCENDRKVFLKNLDTSSLEKYQSSVEQYREIFATQIIGRFDLPLKKFNARARKFCDKEKYVGYEIVLDVFDDVIAYGIVLMPKGMRADEKRPVVVCQHGLEGRPQDIVQGDHRAYHDFAAKLAEEGFITFSPQNLYIFRDRFRTLQRKANTIGKTLFSVIVPQHQQIVNWLKSLPNVDSKRIAFYGLSYGGKSAMRIPPLVKDYCLSICSADFNEWVWKNASTSSPYSYVWTGEYEIFEFDLGNTFNYAEMAALIAPRPFMVERGHFDGVSSDERVAYEFAKVRHLYQAKLKLKDRCEIEFFDGPHTINGKGTFDFLRKHLDWPTKE